MNLTKILEEHKKSFLEAKDELEASRLKKPDRQFPVKVKEQTIMSLQARVSNLVKAKEAAIQDFDTRIKSMQADILKLNKEVQDTKSTLFANTRVARGTGRKNKNSENKEK